jgi:hypothetical protein
MENYMIHFYHDREIRPSDLNIFTTVDVSIRLLDPRRVEVLGSLDSLLSIAYDRSEKQLWWMTPAKPSCVDSVIHNSGWWWSCPIRYYVAVDDSRKEYLYTYKNGDGWQYFDRSGREVSDFAYKADFEVMNLPHEGENDN